jgi:hypothetical protein
VSSHGRIDEYLDGVLADAAMDEFLTHLADCPACQAELHAAIQLRDREDALRAEVGAPPAALDVADAAVEDAPVEEAGVGARRPAERPAPVVSLAARRRRVVALVIAGAALAAAAALVILPRGRGGARERAVSRRLVVGPGPGADPRPRGPPGLVRRRRLPPLRRRPRRWGSPRGDRSARHRRPGRARRLRRRGRRVPPDRRAGARRRAV